MGGKKSPISTIKMALCTTYVSEKLTIWQTETTDFHREKPNAIRPKRFREGKRGKSVVGKGINASLNDKKHERETPVAAFPFAVWS